MSVCVSRGLGLFCFALLYCSFAPNSASQEARKSRWDQGRSGFQSDLAKTLRTIQGRDYQRLRDESDAVAAAYAAIIKNPVYRGTERIDRLTSFIEGRLGLALPEKWVLSLAFSSLSDRETEPEWPLRRFPKLVEKDEDNGGLVCGTCGPKTHVQKLDERPFHVPESIRIRNRTLITGDHNVPLADFARTLEEDPAAVSEDLRFLVFKDHLVIAVNYMADCTFPIYCLRVSDGAVLWTRNVWAFREGEPQPLMGWFLNEVSLDGVGDRVYVFGYGLGTFYIEGFALETGKHVFRFCPADQNLKDSIPDTEVSH